MSGCGSPGLPTTRHPPHLGSEVSSVHQHCRGHACTVLGTVGAGGLTRDPDGQGLCCHRPVGTATTTTAWDPPLSLKSYRLGLGSRMDGTCVWKSLLAPLGPRRPVGAGCWRCTTHVQPTSGGQCGGRHPHAGRGGSAHKDAVVKTCLLA